MNEFTRWIEKNKKTIGIIALILFAIGVFVRNTRTEIPFFTSSILGDVTTLGFNIGIILALVGILLMATGVGSPVGLILFIAGLLLAGANAASGFVQVIDFLTRPAVAIVLGVIFLIIIFGFKKRR